MCNTYSYSMESRTQIEYQSMWNADPVTSSHSLQPHDLRSFCLRSWHLTASARTTSSHCATTGPAGRFRRSSEKCSVGVTSSDGGARATVTDPQATPPAAGADEKIAAEWLPVLILRRPWRAGRQIRRRGRSALKTLVGSDGVRPGDQWPTIDRDVTRPTETTRPARGPEVALNARRGVSWRVLPKENTSLDIMEMFYLWIRWRDPYAVEVQSE